MNVSTKRSSWLRNCVLMASCVLMANAACDSAETSTAKKKEDGGNKEQKMSDDEAKKKKAVDAAANMKKAEAQCDVVKSCATREKHQEGVAKDCKKGLKVQVEAGCTEQVVATLACFKKNVCGADEVIEGFRDFAVLSRRHKKCGDETAALEKCMPKSAADDAGSEDAKPAKKKSKYE